MRRILVPVLPDCKCDVQYEAALNIAKRVDGHINGIYLRPDAERATPSPKFVTTANTFGDLGLDDDAFQERAFAAFNSWRRRHNLASEPVNGSLRSTFACWSEQQGPLETTVLQHGRLSDLIVLAYPEDFYSPVSRLFDIAVFETGRPVLLAPSHLPDDLLRHVIIAWNGSLEATRALAGALPLLHAADSVSVFSAPWHDDELMDDTAHERSLPGYLAWHGIHARSIDLQDCDHSLSTGLLRIAVEQQASLIIMGAHTRSRIHQVLLGGLTRDVLLSRRHPVLMALEGVMHLA